MSRSRPRPSLYALLGDPIAHSLSPRIQNAALRSAGLDASYVALRTDSERLEAVMRSHAGGNVTLPHKTAAAGALDRSSTGVLATRACNTFWWDADYGLCGDNTDIEAFRLAAEHLLHSDLTGRKVLLLGAGGVARAVTHACVTAGVAQLQILNRTLRHARSLLADLGDPRTAEALANEDDLSGPYDLIVNATSLGLSSSDPLPIDPARLEAGAVLDLVYGADETSFVLACRKAGLPAVDGRRMLVEQAALAFEHWFAFGAPREVMGSAAGLPDAD